MKVETFVWQRWPYERLVFLQFLWVLVFYMHTFTSPIWTGVQMKPLWTSCPPWLWIKLALTLSTPTTKEVMTSTSAKKKNTPPTSLHLVHSLPTPPFTLHFTADIISQISAHLERILTDFDGLGEESHPTCYRCTIGQTLSLIRAALVLKSNVPINHWQRNACFDAANHTSVPKKRKLKLYPNSLATPFNP